VNRSNVTTSRAGRRALTAFFAAFLVFLYLPSALLILFSFNTGELPKFPLEGFTTHWFEDAWKTEALRTALRNSVVVAFSTSVLATALGLITSLALAQRRFRGHSLVSGFVLMPLVVPYVVLGVSLLILFSKGPIGVDPGLTAVVLGHGVITLPYTILLLLPRLSGIDRSLDEAARDLGASPLYRFRRITLPLITPALLAAFIISFVLSIDEFAIASFLVGDTTTYPVYLFSQLRFASRLPLVIAVATVMITFTFLLVIAAEVIRRRGDRRLAQGHLG
jgi:spermidine/putrescine transport system permease protein